MQQTEQSEGRGTGRNAAIKARRVGGQDNSRQTGQYRDGGTRRHGGWHTSICKFTGVTPSVTMIDLEAETLFYKTGDVEAQALIYTLAETVTRGNSLANVKTDAMVDTLAATLSKKVIQILCNEK